MYQEAPWEDPKGFSGNCRELQTCAAGLSSSRHGQLVFLPRLPNTGDVQVYQSKNCHQPSIHLMGEGGILSGLRSHADKALQARLPSAASPLLNEPARNVPVTLPGCLTPSQPPCGSSPSVLMIRKLALKRFGDLIGIQVPVLFMTHPPPTFNSGERLASR